MRTINLAYLMPTRREFDVEAYLARLQPKMFGIDLHWLGLAASYYHEELAANPYVDFVLHGDSTEEPCRQLLAALRVTCRWPRWRT